MSRADEYKKALTTVETLRPAPLTRGPFLTVGVDMRGNIVVQGVIRPCDAEAVVEYIRAWFGGGQCEETV